MKVLVADDSAVTRQLLISTLKSWDYETLEARDGEEAWQLFQTHPVSLVLTDWIMPGMDGLELIRRIRDSAQPGYCYLILLTAKSDKEDLVCAMEAGADDFLVKPCDQQELRVRLREGVRIIRLEQELAQQNRQLRDAQAALVQSEKLAGLGQLAAGMAHEVNNPIAFVSNNLAVLKREFVTMIRVIESYQQARPYLTDAPQELLQELSRREEDCDFDWLQQYLPQLLASSTHGLARVTDIVSNLRDFARLDQATCDLLDLGQAIRSTLEMLNHSVEEKRLTIQWDLDDVPKVLCHPEKINQVIYNVVLNAIQASPVGAYLTIGLALKAGKAQIEVTDYGDGMDAATLSRVFEPFFTTKPVGTGSGLGMAVSYGIMRDHGGSIAIQSQPGEGTTVQVDLPLKPTVSRKLAPSRS